MYCFLVAMWSSLYSLFLCWVVSVVPKDWTIHNVLSVWHTLITFLSFWTPRVLRTIIIQCSLRMKHCSLWSATFQDIINIESSTNQLTQCNAWNKGLCRTCSTWSIENPRSVIPAQRFRITEMSFPSTWFVNLLTFSVRIWELWGTPIVVQRRLWFPIFGQGGNV